MRWLAKTAFGLEGQVSRDLKRLSCENVAPQAAGGVLFDGGADAGYKANMWLRCADRVMLVIGQFEATTFDGLFEAVKALRWADYIPRSGKFPVAAHCARSTLMSPSDVQAIVKKAVVERLKQTYRTDWFDEDGETYQIDVSIHGDVATVCLNASGEALNKRGYRTWNGEAPLRETLAAALLLNSPWHANMPLYDPCCGTGTLLIEGAFIATDRAPGLARRFDCEAWGFIPESVRRAVREEAEARFEAGRNRPFRIAGSDIDPSAIDLCRRHLRAAQLSQSIEVRVMDLSDVRRADEGGAFICNPPYGERMGDQKIAAQVEQGLEALRRRHPTWSLCAISADMSYERHAGRRADKKRRYYNGRLECDFLTFGPVAGKGR